MLIFSFRQLSPMSLLFRRRRDMLTPSRLIDFADLMLPLLMMMPTLALCRRRFRYDVRFRAA